jgi:hypothetical protein
MAAGGFSHLLISHWRELQEKLKVQDENIVVDGRSLSLAGVVVCARYVCSDVDLTTSGHLDLGSLTRR